MNVSGSIANFHYSRDKVIYVTDGTGAVTNLYAYCENNPIELVDPDGHYAIQPWEFFPNYHMGDYVSVDELKYLSSIDLLARTLYGECAADKDFELQSVAWTIINRQTLKVSGNSYYMKSYRDIVIPISQYTGLTGTGPGEGDIFLIKVILVSIKTVID